MNNGLCHAVAEETPEKPRTLNNVGLDEDTVTKGHTYAYTDTHL